MRRPSATSVALAGVLLLALGLRLWSVDHGLPYVFNQDEALHYVPNSVDMFRGSLNPDYFQNPAALTYLFHLVFRVRFAEGFPFGGTGFASSFLSDPEPAFLTARVLVALLGTLGVGLVHWLGSRVRDAGTGLVAAGVMATAFLPVFYSKHALNDAAILAPVAAALVLSLAALDHGRRRDWLLAGILAGVATATKYTGGLLFLPLVAAAYLRVRAREDTPRSAALSLCAALAAAVVTFLLLNPYALLDFGQFRLEVQRQAEVGRLLGQDDGPGWLYYGGTLTWGLGVLPVAAAAAGAVLLARRAPRRAFVLLAYPLALFLVLGADDQFFARWLLPSYPVLAVLAGYALVRAAEGIGKVRTRRLAIVAGAVALCAQGVVETVRVNDLLSRPDTRELAREWMIATVPRGTRVVVEPFLPRGFLTANGRKGPELFDRYPIKRPFLGYERKLHPGLVDVYRRNRYCLVVIGSHQRDRGLADGLPGARAYYARLERESQQLAHFSPYRERSDRQKFSYDFSFNHLPLKFERPGPEIEVRRLPRCG